MEIVSSISHIAIPVQHASQVGEARRAANRIARELRFTDEQGGKLAVVTTESATNLAKHAKEGQILLCPCVEEGASRVDVIAIDKGPGIGDVNRSLGDGFSTAGSPGNGMGAISRMSDYFDIYSDRATGSVVYSRVYASKTGPGHKSIGGRLQTGFVCIPMKGEQLCGDTVAIRLGGQSGVFMLADGLGHGIAANDASREAAKIFAGEVNSSPGELMDHVHHGLRATRGAAVGIAEIDFRSQILKYSGVGNIAAAILHNANSRSLISHNGIVGHQTHKIQEFTYPWVDTAMLIMNSDGLQTSWRLTSYPGLLNKAPAVIAAVLYRDFSRGRDDVGVLVVKQGHHA